MSRAIELMKELLAPEPENLSERALQLETVQRIKNFVNKNKNHNIKIFYCNNKDHTLFIGITNNTFKNPIDYEILIHENFIHLTCQQLYGSHTFAEEI